jgi:hypothetical protein
VDAADGRLGCERMRRALEIAGRLITLVTLVVCALLVLGVVLIVAGANSENVIVENVVDAARFLAGPFRELFDLDGLKQRIALNWLIATAVYAAVGLFVGRQLKEAGARRSRRR